MIDRKAIFRRAWAFAREFAALSSTYSAREAFGWALARAWREAKREANLVSLRGLEGLVGATVLVALLVVGVLGYAISEGLSLLPVAALAPLPIIFAFLWRRGLTYPRA